MKLNTIISFLIFAFLFLLSACYTYNVPSGATTPLINEKGESSISLGANFNEIGGNFTYALTDHVLFSTSGNVILWNDNYNQDYDSVYLYKKQPNKFELAFGYYGTKNKFVNMILFGVGTGNNSYEKGPLKDDYEIYNGNYVWYTNEGYYKTDYTQYFIQYTAGFKYLKRKKYRNKEKNKQHGLSLRYAYHEYQVSGIETLYRYEEIYDDQTGYWEYNDTKESYQISDHGYFQTFSCYYFYRFGNEKILFEISPGFTVYDSKPEYEDYDTFTDVLHFNAALVFNLNNLFN